jgi:hypothetical protein
MKGKKTMASKINESAPVDGGAQKHIGDGLEHGRAYIPNVTPVMTELQEEALKKLRELAESAGGIKEKK